MSSTTVLIMLILVASAFVVQVDAGWFRNTSPYAVAAAGHGVYGYNGYGYGRSAVASAGHQRLPNLLTRYRDDGYVRTSMRSMQALAFVPPQFVYNYFCIVMSTLEPTPELQEFILYFVNTWLGPRRIIQNEEILEEDAGGAADNWIRGQIEALNLALTDALFPIELWNVMERGWHSAWNVHLKGNQRASSFARKMVEEDDTWQHIVTDFQGAPADGIKGPYDTRKAQYIRQDRNLEALVADFQNRDPLEFLRSCAYH
uniref:Uncharacterized protein n=1 Tax=Globodera pallida TaxID=36090 RepID=A0A183CBZ0_GLOPA